MDAVRLPLGHRRGSAVTPDYTEIGQGPVFNRRALDELGSVLDGHVTEMRDARDTSLSAVSRFDDGGIMSIDTYVFVLAHVVDATIFKLPQPPHRNDVTGAFAERVRSASLTGMELIERWRG